jgi:hypothetical protein
MLQVVDEIPELDTASRVGVDEEEWHSRADISADYVMELALRSVEESALHTTCRPTQR